MKEREERRRNMAIKGVEEILVKEESREAVEEILGVARTKVNIEVSRECGKGKRDSFTEVEG